MYTYLNNGGKKGTKGEKHGITQKQVLGSVRKKTLLEKWVGPAQGEELRAPRRRQEEAAGVLAVTLTCSPPQTQITAFTVLLENVFLK